MFLRIICSITCVERVVDVGGLMLLSSKRRLGRSQLLPTITLNEDMCARMQVETGRQQREQK